MRRLMTILAACALAAPAWADPAQGLWRTGANDAGNVAHVRIAPCGAQICGQMVASFDASGRPIEGPDSGAVIVRGMQPAEGGRYEGGTITDPQAGRTYRARMALSGDVLEVSGCVAGGLVCRTQVWSRVR